MSQILLTESKIATRIEHKIVHIEVSGRPVVDDQRFLKGEHLSLHHRQFWLSTIARRAVATIKESEMKDLSSAGSWRFSLNCIIGYYVVVFKLQTQHIEDWPPALRLQPLWRTPFTWCAVTEFTLTTALLSPARSISSTHTPGTTVPTEITNTHTCTVLPLKTVPPWNMATLWDTKWTGFHFK